MQTARGAEAGAATGPRPSASGLVYSPLSRPTSSMSLIAPDIPAAVCHSRSALSGSNALAERSAPAVPTSLGQQRSYVAYSLSGACENGASEPSAAEHTTTAATLSLVAAVDKTTSNSLRGRSNGNATTPGPVASELSGTDTTAAATAMPPFAPSPLLLGIQARPPIGPRGHLALSWPQHGTRAGAVGGLVRHDTAAELAREQGIMHPVASWGSLSVPISSPCSSCNMSSTNLAVLGTVPAAGAVATAAAFPSSRLLSQGLALTSAEVAAASAVNLAAGSNAKLLLVVTDSGHTVAIVAKYKPRMPILSLVVPSVHARSGLHWEVKVCPATAACEQQI
jgi:hypothetical protein